MEEDTDRRQIYCTLTKRQEVDRDDNTMDWTHRKCSDPRRTRCTVLFPTTGLTWTAFQPVLLWGQASHAEPSGRAVPGRCSAGSVERVRRGTGRWEGERAGSCAFEPAAAAAVCSGTS